jgi:hypothetical protein
VFVTSCENTKVGSNLVEKLFPPHIYSNILTNGTMVVYLDQIVVFNDSSSKPSLDNDEVVKRVAKKRKVSYQTTKKI